MGGLPPGPSASPLRQAAEWVRRPLPLLEECGRRYGETFTLRLAGLPPMVMITRPGTVREVFTGDPEVLRSGEANALLSAGLGKRSLLVLDGADHLRERRLMLPPFHGERMRQYGDLIRAIAEREIATWPAGAELALAPRMRTIALEVIVRAVFGVEGRERVERLQRALGRLLDSSSRPHRVLALLLIAPDGWTVRTWRRHAPTIRRVDALLLEEIRLRRADPCAAERPDILSLLLAARYEDRAPMGDAHLRDELAPRYAEMVYNGFWFSPERRALQAFMDEVQKRVNGEARLRLYKGNVIVEGRRSETYDLYDQATATFEEDDVYDQADAAGFIRLNALRLRRLGEERLGEGE